MKKTEEKIRLSVILDKEYVDNINEIVNNNELATLKLTPSFLIEIGFNLLCDKLIVNANLLDEEKELISDKQNPTRFAPSIYKTTKKEMQKLASNNKFRMFILTEIIINLFIKELETSTIEELTLKYLTNTIGDNDE